MRERRPKPPAPVVRVPVDLEAPNRVAWEMIEDGRYRPRRIRGSFPGRELG